MLKIFTRNFKTIKHIGPKIEKKEKENKRIKFDLR
jgi:hypothetical protein